MGCYLLQQAPKRWVQLCQDSSIALAAIESKDMESCCAWHLFINEGLSLARFVVLVRAEYDGEGFRHSA